MKIIFFGDSITESGRDVNNPYDLGDGYVRIAAGKLRLLYPETRFEFLNRGVGGERTAELLARVERDVVSERPDVTVLFVGVNDVWHRFLGGAEVSEAEFENNYRAIVTAIKKTGSGLILMQPYALPVGDKQRLRPQLVLFHAIIRRIAEEEKVTLIPLDEIFTGVTRDIAPAQFAADGVHPTHRGCRYIADLVIKELKKTLE